jgi:hypothetical protein
MTTSRRTPGSRQPVAPRAPRRAGDRTTLRVPDDLAASIERYAEEHQTSANDALVRLAYEGASAYEREREIAQLARVRGEAIMRPQPVPPGTPMLTAAETTDAILAWRRGLVD